MRHTKDNEQLQLCSFFKRSINYIRQTFVVAMLTAIIVRNSCMRLACNWNQLKHFHFINCVNWFNNAPLWYELRQMSGNEIMVTQLNNNCSSLLLAQTSDLVVVCCNINNTKSNHQCVFIKSFTSWISNLGVIELEHMLPRVWVGMMLRG